MNPGDRDAKVIFLLGGLIVALYFFTIFALIYRYSLSLQLLKEGGIYETIGALACLGAALMFFMAYIKYPLSNTLFPLKRNLFVLMLALGSLFLFFEEISWGQRLFGVITPDWFVKNNAQREINLHNLSNVYHLANPVGLIILRLYFLVLTILVYAVSIAKRWCKRIALPVPDIQVAFYFCSPISCIGIYSCSLPLIMDIPGKETGGRCRSLL